MRRIAKHERELKHEGERAKHERKLSMRERAKHETDS
jgi:hypothetical protein